MQVLVGKIILLVCLSSYVVSVPIPDTGNSARIVNGYEVDITEVPYQAAIKKKAFSGWTHMCGAVVVSSRGILTAAHCAESYVTQPSDIRVTVGTANRVSGGKNYDVSVVYVHEQYSSTTLDHDIALLGTAKYIEFGETVYPIQIASQHYVLPSGTGAIVSGFGTTSYEGTASDVLLATRVSVVSQAACTRAYLRIAAIGSGMVCAQGLDPARDSCQGDSGGPLVVGSHVVGIVSWGEGCAHPNYPGVYTRISTYSTWIGEKMKLVHQSG